MARKCPDCPPPGAPAYMLTWGDLMSLLLTFFIMLVAYSSTSEGKFKTAAESLKAALTGQQPMYFVKIAENIQIPSMNMVPSETKELTQAIDEFLEEIKALDYDKYVQILTTDKGISIRLLDPVLFETGSDKLRPAIFPILQKIVRIAEVGTSKITIDGFTDDSTPPSQFSTNWHLSSARSISVALFMIQSGLDPQRFTVSGNGEYKPVVPNMNASARELNRRVEIFLAFKDKYTTKELSPFAAWDEVYLREMKKTPSNEEPGTMDINE